MTPEAQRIAIAQACDVEPRVDEYWVHSESEHSFVFAGSKGECEKWVKSLPQNSKYRNGDWKVTPHEFYHDYLHDLNAIAAARQNLSPKGREDFVRHLAKIVEVDELEESWWRLLNAPADKQAEAFLRTLGLWKD